jgi:PAS domain S-box-containing protein
VRHQPGAALKSERKGADMTLSTSALRVLYVEDNPVDADLTRRELARLAPELRLEVVTSLAAAREALAPACPPFDVVLADLNLPDGSGLELLAQVRERELPLAVVIITGSGDQEAAVAALKAGADDYLVKRPGQVANLPRALSAAFSSFRLQRERRAKPLRVLYAESNGFDIDLTRRYLAQHAPHIRLEVVGSGEEMLARLPLAAGKPAPPIDVLLLDYQLLGLNALEVVKILRQERGIDLPIVLVTGHGNEDVAVRALRLGVDDYLVKHEGYLQRLPAVLEKAEKQAELNISEERYRCLFENNQAVMLVVDPKSGEIVDANPAAAEWYGWPRQELCRKNMSELTSLTWPEAREQIEGAQSGKDVALPCGHRRADGAVRDVELFSGPVTVAGRPFIYCIVQDITERKRAEEALAEKQSLLEELNANLERRVADAVLDSRKKDQVLILQGRQAAMGEMIGNIAHQWRQPLNSLGLIVQELLLTYGSDRFNKETLEAGVGKAMGVISRMSKTFDDFSNYFKPDLEKGLFNVSRAIAKTLALVGPNLKHMNIGIEVVEKDDAEINGFENEYSQVLLNILLNCRDAFAGCSIDRSRAITITVFKENGRSEVTVADNAGGIPADIMDKIFDPYFTTKGPGQGTGIGLYMAKTIIEKNMSGRLTVRNTADGAEFRIEV